MPNDNFPWTRGPYGHQRRITRPPEDEWYGSCGADEPESFISRAVDQARCGEGGFLRSWATSFPGLSPHIYESLFAPDAWLTEVAQAQLEDRFERLRAKHPRAATGDLRSGLRSLSRVLSDRPPPAASIEFAGSTLESHAFGLREWILVGIGRPRLLCVLPIGRLAAAGASLASTSEAGATHQRRSLGRTRRGGAGETEGVGR